MKKDTTIFKQLLLIIAIALVTISVKGQDTQNDEEIIRVNTTVGQISLAVEQTVPEPFRFEVTDNGIQTENVNYEAPAKSHPVDTVIIVAMNPVNGWKTGKSEMIYQIKKLQENGNINLLGINVIKDVEGFGSKLIFPKNCSSNQFSDLGAGINSSVSTLRKTPGTRKAILVLTNEVESLPVDIIERTNQILGQASVMVYMMSVNEMGAKRKVIARTNINGQDIMVFKRDYLGGLFRSFTRLATNLYTVSYTLPEQDTNYHKVQVLVKSLKDSREIVRNIREFNTAPAADVPVITKAAFRKDSIEDAAINAVINNHFDSLLKKRAEKLSAAAISGYEQELRRRPELSNVEILSNDDPRMQALSKNLAPVLRLYDRDNYTKLFIYKGDSPFIGLYRECIIIFSTKSLELLSEEQVRASVAHELAHEVFIDEMREAGKANNNEQRHLIEFKCDVVAAMALESIGDAPLALADSIEIVSDWYAKYNSKVDNSQHPSAKARKECLTAFLKLKRQLSFQKI